MARTCSGKVEVGNERRRTSRTTRRKRILLSSWPTCRFQNGDGSGDGDGEGCSNGK